MNALNHLRLLLPVLMMLNDKIDGLCAFLAQSKGISQETIEMFVAEYRPDEQYRAKFVAGLAGLYENLREAKKESDMLEQSPFQTTVLTVAELGILMPKQVCPPVLRLQPGTGLAYLPFKGTAILHLFIKASEQAESSWKYIADYAGRCQNDVLYSSTSPHRLRHSDARLL